MELRLACRGTYVHAYDAFHPLINAWHHIVEMPQDIERDARKFIRENYHSIEAFDQLEDEFHTYAEYEKAVAYIVLLHVKWNSVLFAGSHVRKFYIDEETNEVVYPVGTSPPSVRMVLSPGKIASYHNPNIQFAQMDFRESLNKHPNLFAYLDPPYPECAALYGDKPEHHVQFPHGDLADILHNREAPWILSYNNVPTVRNLYSDSDFHYKFPHWRQSMRKDHSSNEVLIVPKGFGLEDSIYWQTLPDEYSK